MADEPSLAFLGRQMERMITAQEAMRDDIRVLTAMVMRIDNSLNRMDDRIRRLEDAAT
jgi:hypothetical protein